MSVVIGPVPVALPAVPGRVVLAVAVPVTLPVAVAAMLQTVVALGVVALVAARPALAVVVAPSPMLPRPRAMGDGGGRRLPPREGRVHVQCGEERRRAQDDGGHRRLGG